ncbi:MAG: hypothetical protein ACLFOY_05710 [Desulfatibacillaceae bacterium]
MNRTLKIIVTVVLVGSALLAGATAAALIWIWNHPDRVFAHAADRAGSGTGLEFSAVHVELVHQGGWHIALVGDSLTARDVSDSFVVARVREFSCGLDLSGVLTDRIAALSVKLVDPVVDLKPSHIRQLRGRDTGPPESSWVDLRVERLVVRDGNLDVRFPGEWSLAPMSVDEILADYTGGDSDAGVTASALVRWRGRVGAVSVDRKRPGSPEFAWRLRGVPLDGLAIPAVDEQTRPMPITGTLTASGVLRMDGESLYADGDFEIADATVHNDRAPDGAVRLETIAGTFNAARPEAGALSATLAVPRVRLPHLEAAATLRYDEREHVLLLQGETSNNAEWEDLRDYVVAFLPAEVSSWVGPHVSNGTIRPVALDYSRGTADGGDGLSVRVQVRDVDLDPGGGYPTVNDIDAGLVFDMDGFVVRATALKYPGARATGRARLVYSGPRSGHLEIYASGTSDMEATWDAVKKPLSSTGPWARDLAPQGTADVEFNLSFAEVDEPDTDITFSTTVRPDGATVQWAGAFGPLETRDVRGTVYVDNELVSFKETSFLHSTHPGRLDGEVVHTGDRQSRLHVWLGGLQGYLPAFGEGEGPFPTWPPKKLDAEFTFFRNTLEGEGKGWRTEVLSRDGAGRRMQATIAGVGPLWSLEHVSGQLGPFSAEYREKTTDRGPAVLLNVDRGGGPDSTAEITWDDCVITMDVELPEARWWVWRNFRLPEPPGGITLSAGAPQPGDAGTKTRSGERDPDLASRATGEQCLSLPLKQLDISLACPRFFLSEAEYRELSAHFVVNPENWREIVFRSFKAGDMPGKGVWRLGEKRHELDFDMESLRPANVLADIREMVNQAMRTPAGNGAPDSGVDSVVFDVGADKAVVPGIEDMPLHVRGEVVFTEAGYDVKDGRVQWGEQAGGLLLSDSEERLHVRGDFEFLYMAPWTEVLREYRKIIYGPAPDGDREVLDQRLVFSYDPPDKTLSLDVAAARLRFLETEFDGLTFKGDLGPDIIKVAELAWNKEGVNAFTARASLYPVSENRWEGNAWASFTDLGDVLAMILGKKDGGTFPIKGGETEVNSDLALVSDKPHVWWPDANVRFVAKNGTMDKGGVAVIILAALSPYSYLRAMVGARSELEGQGMVFDTMEGEFDLVRNRADVESFVFDGSLVRYVARGEIQIEDRTQDLVICMQPFDWLNSIIRHAPGLNWLLLNENDALIEACFRADGSINDPDITPLPASLVPTRIGDLIESAF